MVLNYELDEDAFVRKQTNFVKNSNFYKIRKLYFIMLPILAIIAYLIRQIYVNELTMGLLTFSFALIIVAIFICNPLADKINIQAVLKTAYRKGMNKEFGGPYKVEITDETLEVQTRESNKCWRWEDLLKADDDDFYVYIYVTKDSSLMLPKYQNDLTLEEKKDLNRILTNTFNLKF
ncbi:YcxB family protein [Terribacillus saccharophilus]|uniref:YcxB family protein n=1 Tax=Terribacillus saccharophilus TaxID=361277 RepID=UPI000C9BB3C0|nr:YcxB family protein [Terribacillus goriensis]